MANLTAKHALSPFVAVMALVGWAAAATADASNARLDAGEIKEKVIGRRIYLATPFGGEFPLNYRPNGRVDGDGEALGLGRFVQPQDRGRWWIKADKLCQQFTTWYDGEAMCFELIELGGPKLKWIRNNGDTGTARIGSRL